MKDDIRSLHDYRILVREYKEIDSASRKEAIEDVMFAKVRSLFNELKVLYAENGRDFVEDSDFQEDRGWLSLDEFDEDTAWLHYSDRWSYGGECDIRIEVPMKYLDLFEMRALERKLYEEHVAQVKRKIREKKGTIEQLKTEVKELEAEVPHKKEESYLKIIGVSP